VAQSALISPASTTIPVVKTMDNEQQTWELRQSSRKVWSVLLVCGLAGLVLGALLILDRELAAGAGIMLLSVITLALAWLADVAGEMLRRLQRIEQKLAELATTTKPTAS
jgi:amino acid permease